MSVFEVGLGGKLDATNIIMPDLCVITSVGLDHVRVLGNTIEQIASEKGGIMKKGVPVVLGRNTPRKFLMDQAKKVGASPVLLAGKEGRKVDDFEEENTEIAKFALDHLKVRFPLTSQGITKGLASRPPCRFEMINMKEKGRDVTVILDVGHNPPALERMFELAKKTFPNTGMKRWRVVFGVSMDKDVSECVKILLDNVDASNVHFVEALHPRAASTSDLLSMAKKITGGSSGGPVACKSVEEGVKRALSEVVDAGGGDGEFIVIMTVVNVVKLCNGRIFQLFFVIF